MADDIVTRLQAATARCWCAEKSQGEPVGKPFFRCDSCDDQLRAADEIERLRSVCDELAEVLRVAQRRHPCDCADGYDARMSAAALATWQEARRG